MKASALGRARGLVSQALLVAFLAASTAYGCLGRQVSYYDAAHRGRLVDAETGNPIEGAVVIVQYDQSYPLDPALNILDGTLRTAIYSWTLPFLDPRHWNLYYRTSTRRDSRYRVVEAETDKDGTFYIPKMASWEADPTAVLKSRKVRRFHIWAPGYRCGSGAIYAQSRIISPSMGRPAASVEEEPSGSIRIAMHRTTWHHEVMDCFELSRTHAPLYEARSKEYLERLGLPLRWQGGKDYGRYSIAQAISDHSLSVADYQVLATPLVRYAVRVIYTGNKRRIPADRLDLIKEWERVIRSEDPRWPKTPYEEREKIYSKRTYGLGDEILFRAGSRDFWLAAPRWDISDLEEQLTPGAEVDLAISWLGSGKGGPVFIFNEFVPVFPDAAVQADERRE